MVADDVTQLNDATRQFLGPAELAGKVLQRGRNTFRRLVSAWAAGAGIDGSAGAVPLPTIAAQQWDSMASQWQNFLRNLGEWRGSFTTIGADGSIRDSSPSVLTLEAEDEDRLVRFGLRRWPAGTAIAPGGGPAEGAGAPSRAITQDYRTLGRQVVFFASGAFNKGSLQVAPNTAFGGEFGFIGPNRRHRLVELYDEAGRFDQLVLIREFRAGSGAAECAPTTADQLLGTWTGQTATISADWPEPDTGDCRLEIGPREIDPLRLLPDGGFCRLPAQISHREAFMVEGGWLPAPGRMERLIRRYDASGAWLSASHEVLSRS